MVQNLRLPPFWPKNLRVWLMQVEAQFRLRHITYQEAKYPHTVSDLLAYVGEDNADALADPEPISPFGQLKAAILKRRFYSECSRLQQLLNTKVIGDRRPADLRHQMRQLLRDQRQDRNSYPPCEFFLKRHRRNMVLVLAAADDIPQDKFAEHADRVAQYSRPPSVATVTEQSTTLQSSAPSSFEERIEDLSS